MSPNYHRLRSLCPLVTFPIPTLVLMFRTIASSAVRRLAVAKTAAQHNTQSLGRHAALARAMSSLKIQATRSETSRSTQDVRSGVLACATQRLSVGTQYQYPLSPNATRAFSTKSSMPNKEGEQGNIAFSLQEVTKVLDGGRVLFKDITVGFLHGAKIGILGKNGAGKSTLMRIIAGVDKNFDGEAKPAPGKKVGYLAQEPVLDDEKTVLENVLDGVREKKDLLLRYEAVNAAFADPEADVDALVQEQAELQAKIDDLGIWDLDHDVEVAMAALRCPPSDALTKNLSGGERRRVALARLLLSAPDILLLDEPTNHLDSESVAWLEQFLDKYPGLVIAITHDRYFLDNVAGYILEIANGRFYPFKGNYAEWLDAKAKRQEQAEREAKNLDKVLSRELAWLRERPNGRQAKGKARIRKIEELQALKEQQRVSRVESGSLVIPQGPKLKDKVISFSNIGLAFNDAKGRGITYTEQEMKELLAKYPPLGKEKPNPNAPQWLFKNITFEVNPGQVIGIVGPNGIGKTTLLKMLTGQLIPTMGSVTVGDSVVFGYNAQTREELNADNTVWQEITQGDEWVQLDDRRKIPARKYVAQFNFSGHDQSKLIGQLSGGERNRVHLARSLRRGCNVLMLDEPTNDLDVDTLRALEEAMNSFEGCSFIVSHDRWFLDRVCTDILGFEQVFDVETQTYQMTAMLFPGNYTEFLDNYKDRTGKDYGGNRGRFKSLSVF